jgi:sporulation protein YlmC with PRC-barrel domain
VVLNPTTEQLTHLVVREARPSRTERLVPIELVQATTPELILLTCSKADFSALEIFEETQFVYTDVPHFATDPALTLIWPFVVPAMRVVDEPVRRIAPQELAMRRGARVRAIDGRIGRVDEFLIDPDSGQITHLILRTDHLWGKKEIAIPVAFIDHIEEGRVLLNQDKAAVAELPSIPVKRSWL